MRDRCSNAVSPPNAGPSELVLGIYRGNTPMLSQPSPFTYHRGCKVNGCYSKFRLAHFAAGVENSVCYGYFRSPIPNKFTAPFSVLPKPGSSERHLVTIQKIFLGTDGEVSPYPSWDAELWVLVSHCRTMIGCICSGHSENAAKRRWLALCAPWLKVALERL